MATFSQWLKDQESRPDEIGKAAVSWSSLTPGRISSVLGIERYIERRLSEHGPDADSEETRWLNDVLAGLRKAAEEYGRVQAHEQAVKAGVIAPGVPGVIPLTAPDTSNSSQLIATPGRKPESNIDRTAWRIEHKLDLLIRIVGALAGDSTSELMHKFGIESAEEESTERGVALWIKRDGNIDFELLFRMADLTP